MPRYTTVKLQHLKKKLIKESENSENGGALNKPNENALIKEVTKLVNRIKKKPIDTSKLI